MRFIKDMIQYINESNEHILATLDKFRKLTLSNPYYYGVTSILTNSDDIKKYTLAYDEEDLTDLKYFFFFKGPKEANSLKTSEFITAIREDEKGNDIIISFSPNLYNLNITTIKDDYDYDKLLMDYIDEIDELEFKDAKQYIASSPINMDYVKKEEEKQSWKTDKHLVDIDFDNKVIGFFDSTKILCNISKRDDSKFWVLILRTKTGLEDFMKRSYYEVIYLVKDIEALGLKDEVNKHKKLQERIDKELKNA